MMRVVFIAWLVLSLLIMGSLCFIAALLYMATRLKCVHRVMWWLYEAWVGMLAAWVRYFIPGIDLKLHDPLPRQGPYILISNHHTWVDILILFTVFHKRMPMFVFVMKRELLWMPILGVVCWGLGHPFLRRDKKRVGGVVKDVLTLQTAVNSCVKHGHGIMIFPEGSRYSTKGGPASGYRYLLKPKSKGLSILCNQFVDEHIPVVDVTLAYHTIGFQPGDFFGRRLGRVLVDVRSTTVTADQANTWLLDVWLKKDQLIHQYKRSLSEDH